VSVVKDLGIPIKFIGVGEQLDDLREFDPEVCVGLYFLLWIAFSKYRITNFDLNIVDIRGRSSRK
jgi:hypothetical protein